MTDQSWCTPLDTVLVSQPPSQPNAVSVLPETKLPSTKYSSFTTLMLSLPLAFRKMLPRTVALLIGDNKVVFGSVLSTVIVSGTLNLVFPAASVARDRRV